MNGNKFYFSTPMTNPDCPFGLKNPCVLIVEKAGWDRNSRIEEVNGMGAWLSKKGFGELCPNFYQADKQELMEPEAVSHLLTGLGLVHNAALDSKLPEFMEL